MHRTENIPIVSIIIPTYNRAHLIGRAIRSVLTQTYRDFELIVVDDGSTDNTKEVVNSFKDERIIYLKHETNRGGGAARNTGIKAARGAYIAFQDSDDEWMPDKLEKQIKAFEIALPDLGVVYTGFQLLIDNKKIYIPSAEINPKEGNIFSSLIQKSFITTPAVLVRKECFEKAGIFDESLPRLQDWELFIRIAKCYHFKYIDESLVSSYYTRGSISDNKSALVEAFKFILAKYFDDIAKDRKLLAAYYSRISTSSYANREMSQARIYSVKAFKTYPFKIKYPCVILAAMLGQSSYSLTYSIYRGIRGLFTK